MDITPFTIIVIAVVIAIIFDLVKIRRFFKEKDYKKIATYVAWTVVLLLIYAYLLIEI